MRCSIADSTSITAAVQSSAAFWATPRPNIQWAFVGSPLCCQICFSEKITPFRVLPCLLGGVSSWPRSPQSGLCVDTFRQQFSTVASHGVVLGHRHETPLESAVSPLRPRSYGTKMCMCLFLASFVCLCVHVFTYFVCFLPPS